jgi:pimeloyl-ACP methyl ester carboxylesterase
MKQLYLIYVPGLGKARPPIQIFLMKSWRLWGVRSEFFVADWSGEETWEQKSKRLADRIAALVEEGEVVGLVAASAGASAAVNVYAARPDGVAGIMLLAGMINKPEDIKDRYRRRNPAFVASAREGQRAINDMSSDKLQRVLSVYGLADELVASKYSKIRGARNRRLPIIGHAPTIAAGILFGVPFFLRSLKRQAKSAL